MCWGNAPTLVRVVLGERTHPCTGRFFRPCALAAAPRRQKLSPLFEHTNIALSDFTSCFRAILRGRRMILSQELLDENQTVEPGGLAFVPSDQPKPEPHRFPIESEPKPFPTDSNEPRRESEVHVPIEELQLLAIHSTLDQLSSKRSSRFRVALFFGSVMAIAGFLGWQQRGDELKQMVRLWTPLLASPLFASSGTLSPVSIVEKDDVSASRVVARSADASGQVPVQMTASDRTAGKADELQQQLQSIAHNLSLMKQNLEQLATNQEQLAARQDQVSRAIASLKPTKQEDKPSTARASRSVAQAPQKNKQDLPPPPPISQTGPHRLPSEQAASEESSLEAQQNVVVRAPRPLRQQ